MKKKYHNYIFAAILIVLSIAYNYNEIIFLGPNEPHMWRQADCLSITMNYFQDNLNFFTPEIHWTGAQGNGKTISEFPIIYFSVAQLWKIFGHHEFIFRAINVLIFFMGLFSLFQVCKLYLNDTFWALFIPLFLFSSPALVYYSNNFLMNTTAFGIVLTATYMYVKWLKFRNRKWLILSMILFTLAGLLKLTSLIIFLAFLGLLLYQSVIEIIKNKNKIGHLIYKLIPFGIVIVIIAAWYAYARYYSSHNIKTIFLQGIYPIWEVSVEKRDIILDRFYWKVLPSVFNKKALAFTGITIFLIFLQFKKVEKKLRFLVTITFIGVLLFLVLWFQALDVHDYYLINILIIIPLTLFTFFHTLKERSKRLFKNKIIKLIALSGLLILIYQAALTNRVKYNPYDTVLKCNVYLDTDEIKLWEYKYNNHKAYFGAFNTIRPYLDSLGINRNDLVVSIPDKSINISLYLMDQKGFTDYGYSEYRKNVTDRINNFIRLGAKYLIINNADMIKKNEEYEFFTKNKIGEFKNVLIFKLPDSSESL